jgi:hypothetical protein
MNLPPPDELPEVLPLVAATLSLMTAWADPCPGARVGPQAQRRLLARKIRSNLFFLQLHPEVAVGFRQVVQNLLQRWDALEARQGGGSEAAAERTPTAAGAPEGASPKAGRWVH